jgi:hypothetical protein
MRVTRAASENWWRRLDSNQRPTDYENIRGTCGVLKVFYFIRFFHRLQGGPSCPLCT